MVTTAREPRAYELMAIFTPELADEDLTNQIQKITSHITAATGAIKETLTDSPWGRRRLAYSIRHNSQDYRDGYYIVFHFDLQPSRMTEIERELKLDVNVMRYLLVHDDPKAGEKNTDQASDPDGAADAAEPGGTPAPPAATATGGTTPAAPAVTAPASKPPAGPGAGEEAAGQSATGDPAAATEEPSSNGAAEEPVQAGADASASAVEQPVTEDAPAAVAPDTIGRPTGLPAAPADADGDPAPASDSDAADAKQEG